MTAHTEPHVTINGCTLTFAQSMALRVAVSSMLMELADKKWMDALGDIGPLYQARLREIERIMLNMQVPHNVDD